MTSQWNICGNKTYKGTLKKKLPNFEHNSMPKIVIFIIFGRFLEKLI